MTQISVIMRTKNSQDTILDALNSLFQQINTDFELIVVDSGSTDSTLDILSRYPHQLIEIAAEDYFPGRVLNLAAEKAQGEYLVFQNSDVVLLAPDALSQLIAPLTERSACQASFARQIPRPEAHLWVQRDYALAFPAVGPAPRWMHYSLPFAAMRRSAWQEAPFYTWAWGSEDTEWGQRQHAVAPDRIAYVPAARVMHSHNYTLSQIYGRRFIEGEADAWIMQEAPGPVQSLFRHALRAGKTALQDMIAALQTKQVGEMAHALPRRLSWEWAHFKGLRHGQRRLATQTVDARQGQQIALQHHCAR